MQRYVEVWRENHGMGSVSLITARGCAYKCRWCSHAVFGHTHRRRDPADFAAEVAHIRERYTPDQVWYADDVFTIHHRWLFEFHRKLERRGVKMPVRDHLARRPHDEGGGARDPSRHGLLPRLDRLRERQPAHPRSHAAPVHRRTGPVVWATHAAQRHGIEVGMFLMWGYDGETEDDLAATIEHVKKANPDVFTTSTGIWHQNRSYSPGQVMLDV